MHALAFPTATTRRRVLVGDVDGDGLADLVYVDDTKVTLWINQSGNRWSDPITIGGTPPVTDVDAVRLVDVLGSGIGGVLWTRRADGMSRARLFFLDFTGSRNRICSTRWTTTSAQSRRSNTRRRRGSIWRISGGVSTTGRRPCRFRSTWCRVSRSPTTLEGARSQGGIGY